MFLKEFNPDSLPKKENGFICDSITSAISADVKTLRSYKQSIKDYNLKVEFDEIADCYKDLFSDNYHDLERKIQKQKDRIPKSFVEQCYLQVNSKEDAHRFLQVLKNADKAGFTGRSEDYCDLFKEGLFICRELESIALPYSQDYKSGKDDDFIRMYKQYIKTYTKLYQLMKQQRKLYNECYFVQATAQGDYGIPCKTECGTAYRMKFYNTRTLYTPDQFRLLQQRMKHINQRKKAKRYGIKTVESKTESVSNVYHYSYLLCYDRNGFIQAKIGITADPESREKANSNTMFPFKNITLRWKCKEDAFNFEQMLLKMSERYKVHEGYGKEWIEFDNNDIFQMWFKDQYMLCEKLATETYGAYKESHVEPKDVLCNKINTLVGKVVFEEYGSLPKHTKEFQCRCGELHKKANKFAKIKRQANANEKQLQIKLEYLEKKLNQLQS